MGAGGAAGFADSGGRGPSTSEFEGEELSNFEIGGGGASEDIEVAATELISGLEGGELGLVEDSGAEEEEEVPETPSTVTVSVSGSFTVEPSVSPLSDNVGAKFQMVVKISAPKIRKIG